jgi:hypothetical protein
MPVTGFEIRRREAYEGGRTFGAAGAYERIDGVLRYAVDPTDARNDGIVDLVHAPRNAQGRVEFEGDITILQPVDGAHANGRLLVDVVNRGNHTFTRYQLAPADPANRGVLPSGDGWLLDAGWTVACIGWQWDVTRGGAQLGLEAPSALGDDGAPIAGSISVTFQGGSTLVPHFMLSDRGHRPYPAADLEQADARLIARDDPNGTRHEVPRDRWRFARVENGVAVPDATFVALDEGFEPGRWYEVIYRTNVSPVVGAGLLAVRDAVSFLRHEDSEQNPARGRITHAFALGISQSGRFLREFLRAGANVDEAGRAALDGVHIHIGGGRRGEFNQRYGQPSVIEPYSLGHLPPFTYEDDIDPYTEATVPGLLSRLRAADRVPRIIATNSATEYWRGDASVLHVGMAGAADLAETPEARTYFFAGTQHGSGTLPLREVAADGQRVSNPLNVTDYLPLLRGAFDNLVRWVCEGVEPPASALPRLADKTAVTRERISYDYMGFTTINQVMPRRMWSLPKLEFGPQAAEGIGAYPGMIALTKPYALYVSAVDTDGNEVAGIRLPDIAVPLATHTGWNPRHPDTGGIDQSAGLSGSTVPFARTAADRERTADIRPSIEERYAGREDYVARCEAVAADLVAQRFLLPQDAEVAVANAAARWDAIAG